MYNTIVLLFSNNADEYGMMTCMCRREFPFFALKLKHPKTFSVYPFKIFPCYVIIVSILSYSFSIIGGSFLYYVHNHNWDYTLHLLKCSFRSSVLSQVIEEVLNRLRILHIHRAPSSRISDYAHA
jgi:hypothetical protein